MDELNGQVVPGRHVLNGDDDSVISGRRSVKTMWYTQGIWWTGGGDNINQYTNAPFQLIMKPFYFK